MSPRNAVPGFSSKLKSFRESRGLSQQQLADAAGTHPDSIVKLEKGDRQPSLELAWRLAKALGVEVAEFLPDDQPAEEPEPKKPTPKKGKK